MKVETLLEKSELDQLNLDAVQSLRVATGGELPDDYKGLPENEAIWNAVCLCAQDRFGFITTIQLVCEGACYTIAYSAHYRMIDLSEQNVSDAVLTEFFNKDTFLLLYPYFRSTLTHMAADLQLPVPVLPVVRQGDVAFSTIEVQRLTATE